MNLKKVGRFAIQVLGFFIAGKESITSKGPRTGDIGAGGAVVRELGLINPLTGQVGYG